MQREKVQKLIEAYSAVDLQRLITNVLKGSELLPTGERWFNEPDEYIIGEALRDEDIPLDKKEAIIHACKNLIFELMSWMIGYAPHKGEPENEGHTKRSLMRLCRVVDVAGSVALKPYMEIMLARVLLDLNIYEEIAQALTRACMGYAHKNSDPELWEEVIKNQELAPYALTVLLRINPHHDRIKGHLVEFWRHEIEDEWDIDAILLTNFAGRKQNSPALFSPFILDVLHRLRSESFWEQANVQIKSDPLTNDWPKVSLENARSQQNSTHYEESFESLINQYRRNQSDKIRYHNLLHEFQHKCSLEKQAVVRPIANTVLREQSISSLLSEYRRKETQAKYPGLKNLTPC